MLTPVLLSILNFISWAPDVLHRSPDIKQQSVTVSGWRLDMKRDGFADSTSCVLRRHQIEVAGGVVTFYFRGGVDTANAQVRIDGAPAQPSNRYALEVADQGVPLGGSDLRNPSGGRVNIPLRVLVDARSVSVRPNLASRHRTYSLAGLPRAVAAAQSQGCAIAPPTAPAR